jgi:hypothetical protein
MLDGLPFSEGRPRAEQPKSHNYGGRTIEQALYHYARSVFLLERLE